MTIFSIVFGFLHVCTCVCKYCNVVVVLVMQSCPTFWNPKNCSLPGSSVHGILQARILEWVAITFSRGFSQPRDQTQVSCSAGRFFTSWDTREVHVSLGVIMFAIPMRIWYTFHVCTFQCVCPLIPSCNTYGLTWVSLTLGVGYLFTAALAKCSHCSLPWMGSISSPPPFLTFKVE